MSNWSREYHEHWHKFQYARTLDDLWKVDAGIVAGSSDGTLNIREVSLLQYCLLERITGLTKLDHNVAIQLIHDRFLPYCLSSTEGVPEEFRTEFSADRRRATDLLRDWVQQFDEVPQRTICESLIGELLPLINGSHSCRALRILGSVGFGTEELFFTLLDVAEAYEATRRDCLECLISCGAPPSHRLLTLAERVTTSDAPENRLYLLQSLRGEALHELALRTFEELQGAANQHYLHVASAVLASSAEDLFPASHKELNNVWELLKAYPMVVLLDSRVAPSLDLPAVIPDMLHWLESLTEIANEAFRCVRVHYGIERCKAPNHLASWPGALSGFPLELARSLAESNTGDASLSHSVESDAKQYACKLLLMSGYPDIVGVLTKAFSSDKDWYLHRRIAELSCGIKIVPLPEFVKRRIEFEHDETGDGSAGFMETDTALKIALSNGTREAFDALLNFGYTFRGGVLLNWIDTLCSVAYELRKNGEAGVLESLCANLSAESKSRHRQMAARALSFLGARRLLDSTVIPSVLSALLDESLPDYTRADLAHSLHSLQFRSNDDATHLVAEIAFKTDQPNLRIESALFLIRQDFWGEYVQSLWNLLGWGKPVEIPSMSKDKLEDWKCIIVAELYRRSPEVFQHAVLHVLDGCDEDVCSRVCRILKLSEVSAPSIVEKLIQRLKRGTSPFGSPAFLFSTIGQMDPEKLLSSELWNGFENWMIGAKLECIDALRACVFTQDSSNAERLAKLEVFCSDSSDAVRRAAVQAIAALTSVDRFVAIWRSWATREAPLWRSLLAAEAVELLPKAIRTNHGDSELLFLRYHRFRKVRDRVREALKAAKERDNAVHCREKLLTMAVGDNGEVLKLFPYGDALAKIGNMEDHRILLAFLTEHQELKLNARVWLQEIINQIGKRFSKQNHDISHEWNSIYDSFDGVFDTNIGKMQAKFNLWKQPAANYREPGTWGGTAVLTEALRLDRMMQLKDGKILADKRSNGYAVVNRVDGAIVNLQGSREYPEKQPDNVTASS